jgi:DNA excision repair protein ERCC-4
MRRVNLDNMFPVCVLVDTREQKFFTFRNISADGGKSKPGTKLVVLTRTVSLTSGDYSLDGHADKIAVERKSKADLFGTVGQGRERFERELARLNEMTYAAVIVEAEWSEILTNPPDHSCLSPKSIYRSVIAWQQRFPRVHWWFCPGRDAAERTTFRVLERYWKEFQRATTAATTTENDSL